MELLQRSLERLPVPVQGLLPMVTGILFCVMAWGLIRPAGAPRGRLWPLWACLLGGVGILFLWTGFGMMLGS